MSTCWAVLALAACGDPGRASIPSAERSSAPAPEIVWGERSLDEAGADVALADLDGDGSEEIFVTAPENDRGGVDVGAIYGLEPGGGPELSSAPTFWTGRPGAEVRGGTAEDVDGDAVADLVLAIAEGPYSAGVVVHYGPITGTGELAAADLVLAAEPGHNFGWTGPAVAGDDDEDGQAELLLPISTEDGAFLVEAGGVGVHAPADAAFARFVGPAGPRAYVTRGGDLDGDGRFDVLFLGRYVDGGHERGVSVLHGPFSGDVDLTAPDATLVPAEGDYTYGSGFAPGDANGDGYADLWVGSRHHPVVGYLVHGPVEGEVALADAELIVEEPEYGIGPASLRLADMDGDGAQDLVVRDLEWPNLFSSEAPRTGEQGRLWVVLGPTGGRVDLSRDAWVSFAGEGYGEHYGGSLAIGDVDGDGANDLIVGSTHREREPGVHPGALLLYTELHRWASPE